MHKKGRGEVEGLEDFRHELGRFYARGRGYEFNDFEFKIARIAEETLGVPCFFEDDEGSVLFEEELIEDVLYIQEREDILVCGDKRLKLRHKVYLVDFGNGDWIGMAPIDVIDVVEVKVCEVT
jgi:hypothetical protein